MIRHQRKYNTVPIEYYDDVIRKEINMIIQQQIKLWEEVFLVSIDTH